MKVAALRLAAFIAFWMTVLLMPAIAKDSAEPLVEVELSETEVIPGQPIILRITVLVPTWLPKPVAFPTFEVPDLLVKLPERATSPVSRTIEGETWSGVSRGYRVSPMVPGILTIPSQDLKITWANPGQTDPLVTQSTIAPIRLSGIVPDGAENLDPFLAATNLTLTEEISAETRDLRPGDSLTRRIALDIEGTSPLFLPSLLPPHEIQGIASYPAEPIVTETTDRNWVSGTRVESTTLVAESGGSGSVPPIEVAWYNLNTKSVETTRLDGFDLRVDGPVARQGPDIDLRLLAVIVVAGGLILFVAWKTGRRFLPMLSAWLESRRAAREATEHWAFKRVQNAVRSRDYGGLMSALEVWTKRMPDQRILSDGAVQAALSAVGRTTYGPVEAPSASAWSELANALETARAKQISSTQRDGKRSGLAELNPG
ncbi:MAG: hypothetical protein AAF678_09815 [Pseudomonadota bacterium]